MFGRTITLANSEVGDLTASRACEPFLITEEAYQGFPVRLVVLRLRGTGVSREEARKKAGAAIFGRSPGSGWRCSGRGTDAKPYRCSRQSQRFSFVWGGGAE